MQARGPASGKPGRCNKTLTSERTRWEACRKSLALGEHRADFLQNGILGNSTGTVARLRESYLKPDFAGGTLSRGRRPVTLHRLWQRI